MLTLSLLMFHLCNKKIFSHQAASFSWKRSFLFNDNGLNIHTHSVTHLTVHNKSTKCALLAQNCREKSLVQQQNCKWRKVHSTSLHTERLQIFKCTIINVIQLKFAIRWTRIEKPTTTIENDKRIKRDKTLMFSLWKSLHTPNAAFTMSTAPAHRVTNGETY